MVWPVVVAVSLTVPELWVKEPPVLVKERSTLSVPEGSVTAPEEMVTLPVVVAFVSAIVHPPPEPLKRRLPKFEPEARTVFPVAVAVSFWTLVEAAMNAPPVLSKLLPMARTFDGRVVVPWVIVKLLVVVAFAVVNVQEPPVPLKVTL